MLSGFKFDRKKMFAPPTLEEKKLREEREKLALKSIQEAKDAAKVCLETNQFKDYWKKLGHAREAIVDLILAIDEPTLEQEWKKFKELQIQLNQLEYLLKEIEKDLSTGELNKIS